MSASRIERIVCALLAAGVLSCAAAQDKPVPENINADDLKIRSEAGDRSATRQLAEVYYLGRGGVEQNFSEAARWYLILAKQGDA